MVCEKGTDLPGYLLQCLLTQRKLTLLIHNMQLCIYMVELYLLMLENLRCEALSVILYNVFYIIPLTLPYLRKLSSRSFGLMEQWTEGTAILHILFSFHKHSLPSYQYPPSDSCFCYKLEAISTNHYYLQGLGAIHPLGRCTGKCVHPNNLKIFWDPPYTMFHTFMCFPFNPGNTGSFHCVHGLLIRNASNLNDSV